MMMNQIMTIFLMLRQRLRSSQRGQTMTEYAFILAAIAIVVFAAYQLLGSDVSFKVSQVDAYLT